MFREHAYMKEIHTTHCVSDHGKLKKMDHLYNCDSTMVSTEKIEQRCSLVGEVR
ncbi:MAG: hypothetical protein JXA20_06275 [Spirochaetes bacterium]|nr:hypothetical protein [Spirochaetota bacterium]